MQGLKVSVNNLMSCILLSRPCIENNMAFFNYEIAENIFKASTLHHTPLDCPMVTSVALTFNS